MRVIPLEDSGTFDAKEPKRRKVESPGELSQLLLVPLDFRKKMSKKKGKNKKRNIV